MTTNKIILPRPFDVWLVPVFFEDSKTKKKVRPVIVLEVNKEEKTIFISAVKVTSHAPRSNYLGEVSLVDWQEEGLLKPSCVRCSKVLRLFLDDFAVGKKFGKLSERDIAAVKIALEEVAFKLK